MTKTSFITPLIFNNLKQKNRNSLLILSFILLLACTLYFFEVNPQVWILLITILVFLRNIKKNRQKSTKSSVIFFATENGKSKSFAYQLFEKLETVLSTEIHEIHSGIDGDPEWLFKKYGSADSLCIFIFPTHSEGKPPQSLSLFYHLVDELANDFRYDKTTLKGVNYAVFGLGNSAYKDNFNVVGKQIDSWLDVLGAKRFLPVCLGDEDESSSKHGSIEQDFEFWCNSLIETIASWQENIPLKIDYLKTQEDISEEEDEKEEENDGIMDLEDLGKVLSKQKDQEDGRIKEMITPSLRQALTKQGYKLIGTHSGVKMCRWTKAMLRGRGGCYKHTFYGIESHRCMEATPSLACANKCVFCWRHHTNPVGTEWRWKMDGPGYM
uniref:Flavodoxin-like domain-containing protein n=1 Tax=Clastoptera arizonana TaxID=38151 RepID=A0A1B6CFF3_9HEMI